MSERKGQIVNADFLDFIGRQAKTDAFNLYWPYDLAIADPPYFKTIGEHWDYEWRTKEEYLVWCEGWIARVEYSLRVGGTLYLFGYPRMLSYLLPICVKHGFMFRQQIVIDKGIKAVAGRATKDYKQFTTCTECIFMFIKNNIIFAHDYLLRAQRQKGISAKDINEALGVKSNGGGMWSIWTGDNVCAQFPSREQWEKLSEILSLTVKYDDVAQTFNPIQGLTDVWSDIDFYEEPRLHPTQKPLKLYERLVLASSNEGDKVLDPFMGSGTTALVCEKHNRHYTCFDKDIKCCNIANRRLESGWQGELWHGTLIP